jgi:hypothetical protein
MSETNEPAKLHDRYRKASPPPQWLLKDTGVPGSWWLPKSAIHIDRDWGVWIDMNITVTEAHKNQHSDRPIHVRRTPTGWCVVLKDTSGLMKTFETSEAHDIPEGFIPAEKVE